MSCWKAIAGTILTVLVLAACARAAEPQIDDTQIREMFNIPADAPLAYQAEDGSRISAEEFHRRLGPGLSIGVIKSSSGAVTLKLEQAGTRKAPPPVTKLPPFDHRTLGGLRIRDKDLSGKPTIVSFFFADCAPCIKEVPILNAFARKHPEFQYLAITFDAPDVAAGFVSKHQLAWPVIAGAMKYIEAAGVRGYPTYLIRSASGEVLGSQSGLDTQSMKDPEVGVATFEKWVDKTLALQGGAWTPLLDARLSNFDIYLSYRGDQIMSVLKGTAPPTLEPVGLNPRNQKVFSVITRDGQPTLRITGEWYGCLVTKEAYSNYRFRARVKWGEKKWEPRLDEPRDSGILYHSRGPFGVEYWKSWALSQEFQVIEGGLGEYWTQASSAFDIRVDPKKPGEEAPRWNPQAAWTTFIAPNNHALAGSDQDRTGEWNLIELVCFEDDCVHLVNGVVVMALRDARYQEGDRFIPMTGGKLQIQSEAAEVFYRDLEIRQISSMPEDLAQYFR